MKNNILETLNIYGWKEIEDMILTSLVTGGSLLLYGDHGCGKNYAIERIAEALGCQYGKVDSSKVQIDDILGIFNPKSLSEGRLEYINTGMKIRDVSFLFIDEINRCRVMMQNKIQEILYEKQIMGQKLDKLVWVWAALNDGNEYFGTEPLDPAFYGRFAVFAPVSTVVDMEDKDIDRVLNLKNKRELSGLNYWNKKEREKGGVANKGANDRFRAFLKEAGSYFPIIEKQRGEIIKYYLIRFQKILAGETGYELNGRRLRMIYQTAVGHISVLKTRGVIVDDISKVMLKIIKFTIPRELEGIGQPLDDIKLEAAHRLTINTSHGIMDKFYREENCVKKIKYFLAADQMSSFERRKTYNNLLDTADDVEKMLVPIVLAPFALLKNTPFSVDIRLDILKRLKKVLNSYFLDKDIQIKNIDDLKLLKDGEKASWDKKLSHIADTIASKTLKSEYKENKIKIKRFLLEARDELKDIYYEKKQKI